MDPFSRMGKKSTGFIGSRRQNYLVRLRCTSGPNTPSSISDRTGRKSLRYCRKSSQTGLFTVTPQITELEHSLNPLTPFLQEAGIPYMVIGGFAVLVWGEP